MIAGFLIGLTKLVSGATVEWRSPPPGPGQRIYFGNHSSHLDFVVIWSALPPSLRSQARPVAGRDYWDKGPVRRYLAREVFNAILIERGAAASGHALAAARDSIQQMLDGMGQLSSLIVFPEGTRSTSGQVGPFKSGLYHLSRRRPDVELIPVHLENLNRILPKGESLPVPMLSRVVFGSAITPPTDAEDKTAFLTRARNALVDLGGRR